MAKISISPNKIYHNIPIVLEKEDEKNIEEIKVLKSLDNYNRLIPLCDTPPIDYDSHAYIKIMKNNNVLSDKYYYPKIVSDIYSNIYNDLYILSDTSHTQKCPQSNSILRVTIQTISYTQLKEIKEHKGRIGIIPYYITNGTVQNIITLIKTRQYFENGKLIKYLYGDIGGGANRLHIKNLYKYQKIYENEKYPLSMKEIQEKPFYIRELRKELYEEVGADMATYFFSILEKSPPGLYYTIYARETYTLQKTDNILRTEIIIRLRVNLKEFIKHMDAYNFKEKEIKKFIIVNEPSLQNIIIHHFKKTSNGLRMLLSVFNHNIPFIFYKNYDITSPELIIDTIKNRNKLTVNNIKNNKKSGGKSKYKKRKTLKKYTF